MSKREGKDRGRQFAQALKSPLRVAILQFTIENGQASPSRASKALRVELGRVSYHTKVLAKSGLLALSFTRKVGGAVEHVYSPVPTALNHPVVRATIGPEHE